jgi:hypothetical protein
MSDARSTKPADSVTSAETAVNRLLLAAMNEHPDATFWMKLVGIMQEAYLIDQGDQRQDGASPELRSAQCLVHNIAKLLHEQTFFAKRPELCAPLLRVSNALFELNHGRVSPLFKPIQRKGHSPGQPNAHALLKGHAARALSELMASGMPIDDAATKIAMALKQASKKGLRPVTARTVINWRERFEQGPGPGAPQAALHVYSRNPGPPGGTPLERGLGLVEELKRYAALLV